jgi:hypothetical protein
MIQKVLAHLYCFPIQFIKNLHTRILTAVNYTQVHAAKLLVF